MKVVAKLLKPPSARGHYFEDKPTSKVQIVYAASYVLESLLVQALILARRTSD